MLLLIELRNCIKCFNSWLDVLGNELISFCSAVKNSVANLVALGFSLIILSLGIVNSWLAKASLSSWKELFRFMLMVWFKKVRPWVLFSINGAGFWYAIGGIGKWFICFIGVTPIWINVSYFNCTCCQNYFLIFQNGGCFTFSLFLIFH